MESAREVQQHSAQLRKELGLRDLVLAQILYVVGASWVGTAAKLGDQHLVFWIAALTLFYLPLAAVVVYLNRLMPLEGGLYQWTKLGFNEFAGFLVAWNLWLYIIYFMASLGLTLATNISYALGPKYEWVRSSKWCILLVSLTLVIGLTVVTTLGLRIGKWVQNGGAVFQLATFGALIILPLFGSAREYSPLHVAMPALSLFSLNIFSKISFGAFSGFEYVAILSGETRSPARTIGRSVILASPVIALMFILGTSSVLAYVSPKDVDLLGPIPQTLRIGLQRFGIGSIAATAIIMMLAGRQIGAATMAVGGVTRLPMVAGWDRLLPQWFSKLHPKYRTPVNSILFVNVLIFVMSIAVMGVGHQEAYQILENVSNTFYAIAYLFMFAIPLIGLRKLERRPPLWLRIAAFSGFAVTLLSLHTGDVPDRRRKKLAVLRTQGRRRRLACEPDRRLRISQAPPLHLMYYLPENSFDEMWGRRSFFVACLLRLTSQPRKSSLCHHDSWRTSRCDGLSSSLPSSSLHRDSPGAQQTPQTPLWDRIKKALQAPNGSDYFQTAIQGAMIPGGVGGLARLRATVISREPPDRPAILTVSMSDDGIADVTLKLIDDSQPAPQPEPPQEPVPLKPVARAMDRHDIAVEDMIREWRARGLHTGWFLDPREPIPVQQVSQMPAVELAPGVSIEFEGIASEFSRAPFMVTFEVSRSKIRIVQTKE